MPRLNAELSARFERDVVPLRGSLFRQAVRLTRNTGIGSVVTKVDGQLIDSAATLAAAVQSKAPGIKAVLAITDPSGDHTTIQIYLGTDQGVPPSPFETTEGVDI
jgi:S1-C subfamily serine protease